MMDLLVYIAFTEGFFFPFFFLKGHVMMIAAGIHTVMFARCDGCSLVSCVVCNPAVIRVDAAAAASHGVSGSSQGMRLPASHRIASHGPLNE